MADPATIGLIMMAGGTIMSAKASLDAGPMAQQKSEFVARQQEDIGKAEVAASQRAAIEKKRQSRLAQSRVLALAAASGGGVLDPGVVNIIAGFEEEGELAARTELYSGLEAARTRGLSAKTSRFGGAIAKRAGKQKAIATIMQGGGSLASKYGN
jgi:hypothetical protein